VTDCFLLVAMTELTITRHCKGSMTEVICSIGVLIMRLLPFSRNDGGF